MTHIDQNQNPYFNDFDENKKFHQILFKPTLAVQSRELSQTQDILQNQIKRAGDFLLSDGSKVIGGNIHHNFETFKYVKVETTFDTVSIDVSTYVKGSIIVGSTSGAKAELLDTTIETTDDPNTLFVRYLTGDSVTDAVQGISVSTSSADFDGNETVTFTGGGGAGASANFVFTGTGGTQSIIGINVTAPGSGYTSVPTIGITGGTGSSVTATATLNTSSVFSALERISDGTIAIQADIQISTTIPTGNSSSVSVDEGVYYTDGFFIKNDAQSIILEKYNNIPTFNVGFDVNQSIITSGDDESLFDPAEGSFNFNATGADRLKIELTLVKKEFTDLDIDDFIQFIQFENGKIKEAKFVPILGELEKTIARRTFDESGSYTVRPFPLSVNAHPSNSTKLRLGLEPGKAFVKGFEHETISTKFIDLDKAQDTALVSAGNIVAQYGSYVIVKSTDGESSFDTPFNINIQETINLYDAVTAGGSIIGTARIRQIEYNAVGSLRMYLYDINLTSDDFATIESIGIGSSRYTDIDDSGKVGGVSGGDVILFDSDFNSMIFEIPNEVIKSTQDPSLATNYQYRKFISGVSFDAGGDASIVLSGTETFPGDGVLSDTIKAINFQIFVTVPGASGLSDGDLLVEAEINDITITSGVTATIETTGTATFTADVIATIQVTAEPVKTKTLVVNQTTTVNTPNTTNLDYDSITKSDISQLKAVYDSTDTNPPRFTIGAIGGTFTIGELVDQDVSGAIVEVIEAVTSSFMNVIVISGTPNATGLLTGQDSGATATPSVFVDQTNIIASYFLDNGQKDNFYDHGRLQLTGTAPAQTDIVIVYNFFTHSASNGYFSVDSYSGSINYADIPQFTSPVSGRTVNLRDVFDFRPRRDDGADTISGAEIPISNTNITADYSYYLPRIDKIYLDKDRNFGIKKGISSLDPLTPQEFSDSITLYVLTLKAFTFDENDVDIRFIDNRRFTMRDIGGIEKRLSHIEYYTSLSLLESDTKNLLITDGAGNNRFKNGILIDSFKGHSVGDVNDPDYVCSIDFENTELRPSFNVNHVQITHDTADSDDTQNQVTGDLITLPYTEENFIVQDLASKAISVNPFNVTTWRGTLTLTPSSDNWVDKTTLPTVTLNLSGENDAWQAMTASLATTTQWNDWETTWAGVQRFIGQQFLGRVPRNSVRPFAARQLFDQRLEQSRTGLRSTVVPESMTTEIGDRVVNSSIVPFIRTKNVTITVTGMKPNTQVYPFFDDVNISTFCTPSGGSAGDPIYTNSSGAVSGLVFAIPNSISQRFRTGDRLFRLIDNTTNSITTAQTTAEEIYHAQGLLNTTENTIISTRVPTIRNETVNQERQITQRTTRTRYWDPLAQTFLIDSDIYPDGVFVSQINLYFKSKATSTTLPITLEIRNTENGFPAQRVVPFSSKTLTSAQVGISADASTPTNFIFDSPVYLLPGEEYAIIVLSNSNEYEAYVAEMGQTIVGGTDRISEQPYAGSLFKSQNASTWTPIQTEDLKFKIQKCLFDITSNGNAIFKNITTSPDALIDTMHVQSQHIEFNTSIITWSYKATTNGGSLDSAFSNFNINTNFNLPTQKEINTDVGSFIAKATLISTSPHISPVIDIERLAIITAENIINNVSTNEENSSGGDAIARYITRRVTLEDGFDAKDLKIFISLNNRGGSTIKVYYKVHAQDDPENFDEKSWVLMDQITSSTIQSASDIEFKEFEFQPVTSPITYTVGSATYNTFKTFAIKIVMNGTSTIIPRIKDLRAIALAT